MYATNSLKMTRTQATHTTAINRSTTTAIIHGRRWCGSSGDDNGDTGGAAELGQTDARRLHGHRVVPVRRAPAAGHRQGRRPASNGRRLPPLRHGGGVRHRSTGGGGRARRHGGVPGRALRHFQAVDRRRAPRPCRASAQEDAPHLLCRNLQMEYIDLYLIHWPVSLRVEQETPSPVYDKDDLVMMDMEGVWKEMEECQRLGLTKAIGVSNFTCKKLDTLLSFATIPPAANQVEVNPYCRQNKLREFCREKGIQLCAYSPLGGRGTIWGSNAVMDCPLLKQIALKRGKTVAQVCLRWLYEQGDCIIVKSFNEKRLRENLKIFDWELTNADRQEISSLPEFRGCRDFYVHESGPYKTTDEFWDGEITGPQLKS